jgi:4-hydroxy-tetrahydrodipicolinate synthase
MAGDKKYRGVVVPMVTPFTPDGKVDIPATEKVVEHLISGGCIPFILGTTGEFACVPVAERAGFVEATVKTTAGRTLTYAGIASNCYQETVDAAKTYADLGIDCVVANLPSYYPLAPDNMLAYFEKLADDVPAPLMLYNITITTHMSIPLDIVEKLSHHPNIVGLKDSEKNEERFEQALSMWKDRPDFAHFTGTAALCTMALLAGSDGIVPSTANFAPQLYKDLYDAAVAGENAKANELQAKNAALGLVYQKGRVLSQSLPALKVIMNELGLCGPSVLPPMIEPSAEEKADILKKMAEEGITA